MGDEGLLRSAFENVVRDAARYTHPGTAIAVTLGGRRAARR